MEFIDFFFKVTSLRIKIELFKSRYDNCNNFLSKIFCFQGEAMMTDIDFAETFQSKW